MTSKAFLDAASAFYRDAVDALHDGMPDTRVAALAALSQASSNLAIAFDLAVALPRPIVVRAALPDRPDPAEDTTSRHPPVTRHRAGNPGPDPVQAACDQPGGGR